MIRHFIAVTFLIALAVILCVTNKFMEYRYVTGTVVNKVIEQNQQTTTYHLKVRVPNSNVIDRTVSESTWNTSAIGQQRAFALRQYDMSNEISEHVRWLFIPAAVACFAVLYTIFVLSLQMGRPTDV